ncbi:MAG TPA: hypothetical protein VG322_00225 [Candidatus Acidoferrales bacterium]|jgi:hypothetical protein|nr:hypothetical protein [Candidatus Acidoferrales bacterium]
MGHAALFTLMASWGVVTVILVLMLIYRSTLSTHDEEQIFLDPAEKAMATRQQAITQKIEMLGRPIAAMFVLSGVLFLTAVGVWLWHGLNL